MVIKPGSIDFRKSAVIIESIVLHNFMSYADAKLDLAPIKVACLTGINGAGKSALFDAVTWALWGQARSGGDELMRLGETQMWVELILQVDGKKYRIKRLRDKRAARAGSLALSKGSLDLQIRSRTNTWKSLTASSMRETQKDISALLHMDFETFTNSVYLRQGKADQFTTKSANERKQVLCEILGLSYFDELQAKARERAQLLKSKLEALTTVLESEINLEESLANLSEAIAKIETKIEGHKEKSHSLKIEIKACTEKLSALKLLAQKVSFSQERLGEVDLEIEQLKSQKAKLAEAHDASANFLANADEIEAEAAKFALVKQRLENLDNEAALFSALSSRALELRSTIAQARQALKFQADQKKRQLAELLANKERLARQVNDLPSVETSYESFKGLLAQEEALSGVQETYVQLRARIENLNLEISQKRIHLEVEHAQKKTQIQELVSIMQSRDLIEKEGEELKERHLQLEALDAEFELVEERGLSAKGKIESLEHEIKDLEKHIVEKQNKSRELSECSNAGICPLCASPILDRHQVLERYNSECQHLSAEISMHKQTIGQLNGERDNLRSQYLVLKQELDSRKDLDRMIGRHNEKLAALKRACEQKEKQEEELASLALRLQKQDYAQVERLSLLAIESELASLNFDPSLFSALQAQIRANRHVEVRYHQLQRDRSQLSKLEQELPGLLEASASLEQQIAKEDYACECKKELAELNDELLKLNYDAKTHQIVRHELGQKLHAQEKLATLASTRAENERLSAEINSLDIAMIAKTEQKGKLAEMLAGWSQELKAKEYLQDLLAELEHALEQCLGNMKDLNQEQAVLGERKTMLTQNLSAQKERLSATKELKEEVNDYLFLASAFGKKGIQAVIIENAVPEIEAEANRILSMLSDNRMHVALKTQDQTKAGNTVETLELVIADEMGTRNYELYSGGEAFKVDFAVRIALSRLLARRAGAKLETLIIDEGFGSQDEGSRQKMTKAIATIQKDFSKILVITHIAEIKERFPTQIHVTKEHGRSSVSLISA